MFTYVCRWVSVDASLVDSLAPARLFSPGSVGPRARCVAREHKGTWSWINQTWEYRRASANVCVDVIDWWNSVICSNPSISHSWYLAESLGLEICSLCSFKFISLVSLNVNECQTCHFYSSCWEISCPFLICFSQRSWWTLRQRLLIWNGPSSQPPNPRYVIPAFTMLSVLLTRTVWWLGIFGFQLFLCYFGYKGVPYMAGNWQNKGRPEWVWDSKYIGSRCFDISTLKLNALAAHQFRTLQPENDIFTIGSADGWLLGYFCQQRQRPKPLSSLMSQREGAYNDGGEEISGPGRKYSTNVSVHFIKMQSRAGGRSLNGLHSRCHLKRLIKSSILSKKNMAGLCFFIFSFTLTKH